MTGSGAATAGAPDGRSARVEIEIATGTLRVEGEADEAEVRAAVERAGYGIS